MSKITASRIKELRVKGGFSQEELSDVAGLSLRTIQRIENGETEPHGNSLKRIAQALDVTPEEIIDWTVVEDNYYLKAMNLSTLTFIVFPVLGILVPYIMWISKKGKIKGINRAGREIVNFQITWNLVYYLTQLITLVINYHMSSMSNINYFEVPDYQVVQTLIISKLVITSSLYVINFIFILLNTLFIHKGKNVKYYPRIPFLRA